jgi:hypothetical protein
MKSLSKNSGTTDISGNDSNNRFRPRKTLPPCRHSEKTQQCHSARSIAVTCLLFPSRNPGCVFDVPQGERIKVRGTTAMFSPIHPGPGVMKINALWQAGSWREVQSCCTVGCDSSPLPPQVGSLLLDVAWGDEGQGEGEIAVFFGPLTLALPRSEAVDCGRRHIARERGRSLCSTNVTCCMPTFHHATLSPPQ